MAKHKNRRRFGRHSMHGSMGFTPDQLERYKENTRDYYAGRNDYVKSFKVLHEHKTTAEKIEPSDETMLAVLRETAEKGYAQFQYQYALALEKLGRKNEAFDWCRKASRQGWPDAKEHLPRIFGGFTVKPNVLKPIGTAMPKGGMAHLRWKETKVCPCCGKKRLNRDFVYCPMCGLKLPQ